MPRRAVPRRASGCRAERWKTLSPTIFASREWYLTVLGGAGPRSARLATSERWTGGWHESYPDGQRRASVEGASEERPRESRERPHRTLRQHAESTRRHEALLALGSRRRGEHSSTCPSARGQMGLRRATPANLTDNRPDAIAFGHRLATRVALTCWALAVVGAPDRGASGGISGRPAASNH